MPMVSFLLIHSLGHKSSQTSARKRVRNGAAAILESQADIEFGVQEAIEPYSKRDIFEDYNDNLSRSPSSSTLSHLDHKAGDGRPAIPPRDSTFSTSDTTLSTIRSAVFSERPRATSVTTATETIGSTDHIRHSSVAFDMPPEEATDVSKELQEALLTKDLKAVFSRASNLIREAGSVDGVLFLDASISSFGGASKNDVMGQKAPGNFHVDDAATTSDDDALRKASDTDGSTKHPDDTKPTESCCSILGFSTRKRSSLKGHVPPPEHHVFPERVLRTLLKRYPHGKVFNFEDDGSSARLTLTTLTLVAMLDRRGTQDRRQTSDAGRSREKQKQPHFLLPFLAQEAYSSIRFGMFHASAGILEVWSGQPAQQEPSVQLRISHISQHSEIQSWPKLLDCQLWS